MKFTWKGTLALIVANATVIALGILGVSILVGECNAFRAKTKLESAPSVAPPTKAEEKAAPKLLPCREVQAIEPTKRDRQKLAAKYNRPDLEAQATARQFELGLNPAEILGEKKLPPMPAGGTALVTLEPDGRVQVTVKPTPEKLFAWRSTYEFGAMGGKSLSGDTRARAWVAVEPMRFAKLHLRAEVGIDLRAGTTDPYALAGVVWRSR